MLEQERIRKQFEELLSHHRTALGEYESAMKDSDGHTAIQFTQICREKQRHIELTERLIEIVEA